MGNKHITNVFNSYHQEEQDGRRRPKCRLIHPGARLIRL